MIIHSRYNLQRSKVFFLWANYQKRQRFSIFQQRSVFPPRHFREISSSLGGVAERCSRRRKKGQRPWRRKEVTRISLPLCTRENGISRWPIIFRKGRFWHRGCHPPLHSEWSIDQPEVLSLYKNERSDVILMYTIFLNQDRFLSPYLVRHSTCNVEKEAIYSA